jgi:hypothetical protein
MTARDYFGAWIRLLGVGFLGVFVGYGFSVVAVLTNPRPNESSLGEYFGALIVCLLLGIYFLRGAPMLVKFAYPETKMGENAPARSVDE